MREKDPRERILRENRATIDDIVRIVCYDSRDQEEAWGIAAMRLLYWLDGHLPAGVRDEKSWLTTTVVREVRAQMYRKEANRRAIEQRHPGRLQESGLLTEYVDVLHVLYAARADEAVDSVMVDGMWRDVWKMPVTADFRPECDSRLQMERWLAALPPKFADVVRWHAIDGETYWAIHVRTGIPPGTLMSRYARAIKRLRAHIEREESETT
jgi:DNA-directed RNA polymerase specialized sigma24 family protein